MSSVFAAMFAALITSTAMGQAGISLPMKVDHRGLIEIPGVLRQASGSHWGAANLVVFGPSWGYAAQDYALKSIQRAGQGSDVTATGEFDVWAETPAFTIQAGDDCLTNWRNRCLRGRRFRSPIS